MTQKRLRESVRKFSQTKEPRVDIIDGELGIPLDGRKIVEVPGRAGFVYVRIRGNQSELIQAYNASVSPIYGLPVLLSRDGNIYKVISRNLDRYRDWGNTPYLPKHGFQHSFNHELGMGADITWVYSQQFMPMLAYPSGTDGSMFLSVNPYFYEYNNQWKYSQSTGTPSFTPYLPSGSQSVMCLLYVKPSDNSLQIAAGSQFSNSITGSAQIAQYIPSVPGEDVIPLAAVRLTSGTTGLLWDAVYDVRKFLHPISTGSAGGTANPPITGSVVIQDEGVIKGSALTLNFVGGNVDASISGSVARVFVTGSASSGDVGGWISDSNTWAFLSADAPSYVVSVNANITGSIGVGMKSQLSHLGSTKNFIVTAVSITGSTSYLNLYGGTDYTLTTGAITVPKYSYEKSPFGFPADPTKWTVEVSDGSQRSQTPPTTNVWYNLGSISIAIPIGCWHVEYTLSGGGANNPAAPCLTQATLSTANNSESDADFTSYSQFNPVFQGFGPLTKNKVLTLASKTTYYMNERVTVAATSLQIENGNHKLFIRARCAYL